MVLVYSEYPLFYTLPNLLAPVFISFIGVNKTGGKPGNKNKAFGCRNPPNKSVRNLSNNIVRRKKMIDSNNKNK